MHLPPPFVRPQTTTEPPALVRVLTREEIHWNRPLFKAPPLQVEPPLADVLALIADIPKIAARSAAVKAS
jgi:hypothetical protein